MKNVFRSVAGKTLLFITCIISTCILAASAAIILYFTQSPMDFYLSSEEALQREYVTDPLLESSAWSVINNVIKNENADISDVDYLMLDEDGNVYSQSSADITKENAVYIEEFGVKPGAEYYAFYRFDRLAEASPGMTEYYTLCMSPRSGSDLAIEYQFCTQILHFLYQLRYIVYAIALAAFCLALTTFIALICTAGKHPGTDEIKPGPLSKVPYDIILCIFVAFVIGCIFFMDELTCSRLNELSVICSIVVICVVILNAFLGLCICTAHRIKLHTLLRGTVIYRLLKLIQKVFLFLWGLLKKLHAFNTRIFKALPAIWKVLLVILGISMLELVVFLLGPNDVGVYLILWCLEKLILIPVLLYIAASMDNLRKSGQALAMGDLSYHTDTSSMILDLKKHGENLNQIAAGMSVAVENRMKSERMKTELITNVSHDIKTPLTSIINYADLIAKEPCENEKITEYSEVLVRQSDKLKRLIEDLVEASKASTGNLEVALAPCDASVFISQAAGEYQEKLSASMLTLITKQPEQPVSIMADGRRMWRVFDNLMNNICKYAQPGTRVYLTLEAINGRAIFIFKNTSKDPLDLTEDELLERFTRGDASRNTEGNGLGLSIAKSMTELQNGTLKLATDGDLFKVILSFPAI